MRIFSLFRKKFKDPFEKVLNKFRKGKDLSFHEYLVLGDHFRKEGVFSKAYKIHKTLLFKKNLSREERAMLDRSIGLDYIGLKQFEEAVSFLWKADNFYGGKDEEVRRALLFALENSGKWDEAIELKKEIMIKEKKYSDESFALYHIAASEYFLKLGDTKKAKKFLTRALKFNENLAEAHLLLADIEKNILKKLEHLEKAFRKFPFIVFKKINTIKTDFLEKGKMKELWNFLEQSNDPFMKLFYISFLLASGEEAKAREKLGELFEYDENNFSFMILLLYFGIKLNMGDKNAPLMDRIISVLNNIEYRCGSCSKSYREFFIRCENCGGVLSISPFFPEWS